MNPEQEEFRDLRRLLALKRHEQPPPGFFNNFSQDVLVRIRAGERIEDTTYDEVLAWEAPWLKRFLNLLDSKPILAGAFGAAVCGLLLAGVLVAEAPADSDGMPMVVKVTPETENGLAPLKIAIAPSAAGPLFERPADRFSSMGAALPSQPRDSLFQVNEEQKLRIRPQLINTTGGN